ncbi:uracil-DNA glycosylase family protein [Aureispira anguillae]|uniref:Uracil-DNA glycosylase family protein n=1 Tax=Aureispira anguillae TaxID=2864201 RepID=A0A915YKP0_9BACT|nr:uracil-DNA glycosylase family protein [Aureispira anguillae]BDS14850.1 uracil-DNA glycosylase family protein [Aureispira anguillae]
MEKLLKDIKACTHCAANLALGPNPVVAADPKSRILIVGQAPGTKVHQSGIPWDDPSGVQLRKWMGITTEAFYNKEEIAIVPMGFCYPGKGKTGDLPPRPECAPLWHQALLEKMPELKLTLLIGQYAQKYYLAQDRKKNLTETVRSFEEYLPAFIPLPHPSPRNRFWLSKNPWFEKNVVPLLQERIHEILKKS